MKRLEAETAELDALLPALLDRAFKGELHAKMVQIPAGSLLMRGVRMFDSALRIHQASPELSGDGRAFERVAG